MQRRWWLFPSVAGLLVLPSIVQTWMPEAANYLLNNFAIQSLLWIALALSYDLSVGLAGTITLAHPAFLGIGAYTAAFLATTAGSSFLVNAGAAVLLAGIVAVLVGLPFFRLSDVFFAIGTLGFAFMTQIVAMNWQDVTRGALCITQISPPTVSFSQLSFRVSGLVGFYYLILAIAALSVIVHMALSHGRMGRAFAAVRGDEGLAQAFALNPLAYKMVAFVTGAMLAALVGVFQAHYVSVLCPDALGTYATLNLLIIVFLGGIGTVRGVMLGALAFTVVPEMARFAQVQAQLVYGIALLLIVLYLPEGIEGVVRRTFRKAGRRRSTWRQTGGDNTSEAEAP